MKLINLNKVFLALGVLDIAYSRVLFADEAVKDMYQHEQESTINNHEKDRLELLFKHSLEAATKISSPVERNKFLMFLRKLQTKVANIQASSSENNIFLIELQQEEWQQIIKQIQKRLVSAKQNLPEGQDKTLITRILTALLDHSTKQLSQEVVSETSEKKEFSSFEEYKKKLAQIDEWLKKGLLEIKDALGDFSPSVFISYAWGPAEKFFVSNLAEHLRLAGMQVRFDMWHNGLSTAIQTEFVNELEKVDYIIVVGSKLYGDKCRQGKNNVVATEARIIAERYKYQPGRILPVLLSDHPKEAFPVFLRDRIFANFNDSNTYLQELGKVILAMCKYSDNYSQISSILDKIKEDMMIAQKTNRKIGESL